MRWDRGAGAGGRSPGSLDSLITLGPCLLTLDIKHLNHPAAVPLEHQPFPLNNLYLLPSFLPPLCCQSSFLNIVCFPLTGTQVFTLLFTLVSKVLGSVFMADYCYQQPASSTGSQWLPENAYSQPNNMNLQDWARAFPPPRHTRVMKPRSAGNSPSSSMSRRRTTVAQSAVHGSSNQYQSSWEAALLASAARNSRPISWHPSSARARGLSNPTCVPDFTSETYATMGSLPDQSMNSYPVYTNDNMMSYPVSAGPTYSPGYPSMYHEMHNPMPLPQQDPALSMSGSQVEPMAWDAATTNMEMSNMTQATSDGWSLDMLSMANIPPAATACPSYASVPSPGELSGPSTPDFLPIQQFDTPAPQEQKKVKGEEELVGMGLYCQPDGSRAQAQQRCLGKGLKLEETFSPSDDENEDADEINTEQIQPAPQELELMAQPSSFSLPRQPSKQALNLLHKSFFFDHDDMNQQTTAAAQPFASLNQPCMNYGYGWI